MDSHQVKVKDEPESLEIIRESIKFANKQIKREDNGQQSLNQPSILNYFSKNSPNKRKSSKDDMPEHQPMKRAKIILHDITEEFPQLIKKENERQGLSVTIELPKPIKVKQEPKLKKFQCHKCLRVLSTKISLNNHLKTHIADLECKKCGFVSSNSNRHAFYCGREKFQCKICQRKFSKKFFFDKHECSYCKICDKIFVDTGKYKKHFRVVHVNQSERPKYFCDLCDYWNWRKDIVSGHIMEVHSKSDKKFNCDLCPKAFATIGRIRKHIELHKNLMKECEICHKMMKAFLIKGHILHVHSNVRPFKCSQCPQAFKTNNKLSRHAGSHNKKFKCEKCGKHFADRSKLKSHLGFHENPEKFQCEYCKKCFETNYKLSWHTKVNHKRHEMKHFQCNKCDYKTIYKEVLESHERQHKIIQEKLKNCHLKCDLCGGVYRRMVHMKMHMKLVHLDTEKIECKLCGKIVKGKRGIDKHVKGVHLGMKV